MKDKLGCILLVEGQHDKSRVASIFDGEILVTNGYQIDPQLVIYLHKAKEYKDVVILVDSDEAGKVIRKHLLDVIPFAKSIEVDIEKCNHKNKHGVAECDIKEIENKLKEFVIINNKNTITNVDLYDHNLLGKTSSKQLRDEVAKHFGILNYSPACFVACLNTLKINKEDIWKFLETIS